MKSKASASVLVAASLCAWLFTAIFAAGQGQPKSFDKAIKETVVDLGVSPYYAGSPNQKHGQLRCHYFSRFVVKELDWGQKGDDWISIALNDPSHPTPCTQERAEGETVIPSDDGDAGYFEGVKGNFVFLDAADCFDRGCAFGVYEALTGRKVFEDQRRLGPKGKMAEISFTKIGDNLVMHYPRIVAAECSLPQKKSECWKEILRNTGLAPQPMPRCVGYGGFDQRTDSGTSDQSDPSVVSFSLEVTIPGFNARILSGRVECWAAD